jgi:hypothetical protein
VETFARRPVSSKVKLSLDQVYAASVGATKS